ncbi:MAG TPA: hypothetical protein VFH43_10960, partial [Candidatus Kapabacteria bacterium]|nr:hypothetical protein [Candidatus Kapabacteria bacterium]
SQRTGEVEELRTFIATLEERVTRAGQERDELREQLYSREREDTQWAVKLTAEEQRAAEAELNRLVGRIDDIERQIASSENTETRSNKKQVEEAA